MVLTHSLTHIWSSHSKNRHSVSSGWGVDWKTSEAKGDLNLFTLLQASLSAMSLLGLVLAIALAQVWGEKGGGEAAVGEERFRANTAKSTPCSSLPIIPCSAPNPCCWWWQWMVGEPTMHEGCTLYPMPLARPDPPAQFNVIALVQVGVDSLWMLRLKPGHTLTLRRSPEANSPP